MTTVKLKLNSSKGKYTKAALLASTVSLVASLGVSTVHGATLDIKAPSGAAVTVDSATNETINISDAGSITPPAGTAAITVVNTSGAGSTSAINVQNTTAVTEILSDVQSILYNVVTAGSTITANVNINAGAVLENNGAVATNGVIDDIGTKATALTITNLGTLKNSGNGRVINTAATTTLVLANTGAGALIQSGLNANAINLNTTAAASTITNTGSIISNGASAITATGGGAKALTYTQGSGLIQGKVSVLDLTGVDSTVNINGGSVIATDGATANAIVSAGKIQIGANAVNVTGILKSTKTGISQGILITPGSGNSFSSNGHLDAAVAGGYVTVGSGTLHLNNNIIDSSATTGGNLSVLSGATVALSANKTIVGTVNNSGTISATGVGVNAVEIISALLPANPMVNAGTITSLDGSAIKNVSGAMTLNQTAGTISAKTNVINFTGMISPINISGGSIIATDGAAGIAIATSGQVSITGGSVQGVTNTQIAGNNAVNFTLGANNAYTTKGDFNLPFGGITVTSGTLNLQNNILGGANSNLTVLAGAGVNVKSQQVVAGSLNLSSGSSKAIFEINNSNLAALNSTQLATTANGRLNIQTGAASSLANAQLSVINNVSGYIANNTTFTLIDNGVAFASTQGATLSVPVSAMYNFVGSINASTVTLKVTTMPLSTIGGMGGQNITAGVGLALDTIGQNSVIFQSTNDANFLALLGELGKLQNMATLRDALVQLVPPTNGISMQSVLNSVSSAYSTINRRIMLKKGLNAGYNAGYNIGYHSAFDALHTSQFWGQIFGLHTDRRAQKGIRGFEATQVGFSLGFDNALTDWVTVGLALSVSKEKANLKNIIRSSQSNKGTQLSLYASFDDCEFCQFVDVYASYSLLNFDAIRRMSIGAIQSTMQTKHDGHAIAMQAKYSLPFYTQGSGQLVPNTSLNFTRVTENGYRETGASPFNLNVLTHHVARLVWNADILYLKNIKVESGHFVPEVHLGLDLDLLNQREKLRAAFIGSGQTFEVNGLKSGRFGVNFGVAASLVTDNKLCFGINYDLKAQQGFMSHEGHLNVRFGF